MTQPVKLQPLNLLRFFSYPRLRKRARASRLTKWASTLQLFPARLPRLRNTSGDWGQLRVWVFSRLSSGKGPLWSWTMYITIRAILVCPVVTFQFVAFLASSCAHVMGLFLAHS